MSGQTTNHKAVEQITTGSHISDSRGVHEVAHVLPYRDGDGRQKYAVTLRPIGPGVPFVDRHSEGTQLRLADDAEIRMWEATSRRRALVAALHALADDIEQHELPVTARLFDAAPGVLRSRADLERWAEYLGTEIRMSGSTPIVSANRPVADGLDLHFHTQITPEPEPEQDGVEQEWVFTFGSGQQHDGRFVRIFGSFEDARERMCMVFGTAWCDQYDWRRFDQLGLPARLTELPEADWPTAARPGMAAVINSPEWIAANDGHLYGCTGWPGCTCAPAATTGREPSDDEIADEIDRAFTEPGYDLGEAHPGLPEAERQARLATADESGA